MDKLQAVMEWLASFDYWGDAQWGIDLTGQTPVSCSLTIEDESAGKRTEDIVGGKILYAMQTRFSFTRVSYGEEEVGFWADEFCNWLRWQAEMDMSPCFGEGITRFYTEKSKLETLGDQSVYTVKLIATYDLIYEVS